MEIDPEARFLKECAKIEGLEADVKSIKSSLKKLSKKVDELQLQGFYDQISALNKKIDQLQQSILQTQRDLAFAESDQLQFHMHRRAQESCGDRQDMYLAVRDHLNIAFANVKNEISRSSDPLEIARAFRTHCQWYSKEHRLKAFSEE